MFTARFFTIAPSWNQLKCLSMDKWMNKMWNIHTMKYYSTIKRNKVLIHTTIWMDLKNIVPSEKSQHTHKKLHILRLLLSVQWSRLCTSARSTGSIPGWGTKIPHATWFAQCGSENSLPTDTKEIFGLKEMFLNWIVRMVVQQYKVLKVV